MGRDARWATIVVDPPWPGIKAGPLTGREGFLDARNAPSRPMPYQTLTLDELAVLPVGALAAADAHLYLWATNRHLPAAFGLVAGWGFTYSTTLVWAKTPMGGGLGGCYGISTEFVLFARRGSCPAASRVKGTWHNWKRPYDSRGKPQHSAKPPEFYRMVESVSPGPRLDMFARSIRAGWDVWGNEVDCSPSVPLPMLWTGGV